MGRKTNKTGRNGVAFSNMLRAGDDELVAQEIHARARGPGRPDGRRDHRGPVDRHQPVRVLLSLEGAGRRIAGPIRATLTNDKLATNRKSEIFR